MINTFSIRILYVDYVGWIWNRIKISTISINYNGKMEYETVIFGGKHNQEKFTYNVISEAKKGHANAIKISKGGY